jgi:hypothetical protein
MATKTKKKLTPEAKKVAAELARYEAKGYALYTGIKDCHGLESLLPITEPGAAFLPIRASANRQRHALTYSAYLKPEKAKEVGELIARDAKLAFAALNFHGKEIRAESHFAKYWGELNDDIDPWWG